MAGAINSRPGSKRWGMSTGILDNVLNFSVSTERSVRTAQDLLEYLQRQCGEYCANGTATRMTTGRTGY